MVRLTVTEGKEAGRVVHVDSFPCRLGRSKDATLFLSDPGVWAHHAAIHLSDEDGLRIEARPEVGVMVNGETTQSRVLQNGDLLTVGTARLQFSFEPPRQRDFRLYGWGIAVGLVLLVIFEVGLIFVLS